jgi:hypothetical protein
LSPNAAPFHPGGSTVGQPKARRWVDKDLFDAFDADSTPTSTAPYLDAIRQGP